MDGSVITWGADQGGDSSEVAHKLASGVVQIRATGSVFAALKEDGSVVTWGDSGRGGDFSVVAGELSSGVISSKPAIAPSQPERKTGAWSPGLTPTA